MSVGQVKNLASTNPGKGALWIGVLLFVGSVVYEITERLPPPTPPRSRVPTKTIEILLQGEDKLSKTEIDLGDRVGWRFEFTGPPSARVHFSDGTVGSIWQEFPPKRKQKMRFTGPAGEKVYVSVFPPGQRSKQPAEPRSAEVIPAPILSLAQANEAIPAILRQIYAALDQGNPRAAGLALTDALLGDSKRLDLICKPFAYRAHHMEAILERPNQEFHVRTRVLFRPVEERAYTLIFHARQNRFVLYDVAEPSEDWFAPDKAEAAELARRFVYAGKAGRHEVLRELVSAGVKSVHFTTDPCWKQFFARTTKAEVERLELVFHQGLKVRVWVRTSPMIGHARFLVEHLDGQYKIVGFNHPGAYCSTETRGKPGPRAGISEILAHLAGAETRRLEEFEDPNLETYTLNRFGLVELPTP